MITADPVIIEQRLGRIRDRILKNYNNSISIMGTIETEFGTYIDRAEKSAIYMLEPIRKEALAGIQRTTERIYATMEGPQKAAMFTESLYEPVVGEDGVTRYMFKRLQPPD